MEIAARALEILIHNEYINIATITPDLCPWNTPVYAVYDDKLNFYWSSWKRAQHSANIRNNDKCFITIYDSTRKRGDNNRRCLYIEASAFEMAGEPHEPLQMYQVLEQLYGHEAPGVEEFMGEGQRRLYYAKSHHIWLNDLSERQVTAETELMRIEVSMASLRGLNANL